MCVSLQYKYKQIDRGKLGTIYTPSIPITLKYENNSLDTIALVDSGADLSLIPMAIAKHLGIRLEGEPSETKGIGGSVRAYESKVTVIVGRGRETHRITIPIKILDREDDDIPVLLGREGFFTHFVVTLDQGEKRITLKHKQ